MDQPNAATIHTSVSIDGGDVADIHVRMNHAHCNCGWAARRDRANHLHEPLCEARAAYERPVAFVAVYVRPRGPIPGYWFTSLDSKEAERAYWLAGAVLGYGERGRWTVQA